MTSLFYKIRNKLSIKNKLRIYHGYVLSKIVYGIEVYANTFDCENKPLMML